MTVATTSPMRVIRWHGGQHPTLENITRRMRDEGLRPYAWSNIAHFRYPVRSHGYDKILYCVRGAIEISLAQTGQRVTLRAGDRVDIPRGVRYSAIIGLDGVECVEGSWV